MPVPKKRSTSASEATKVESSDQNMPDEQEFRQRMRNLAVGAMRVLIEEVMREELLSFLCAEWREYTPERKGYRNGSYPRDPQGVFHSQAFERYSRYESEVTEALTNISISASVTHKVRNVADTLMGVAPSASTVNRLN